MFFFFASSSSFSWWSYSSSRERERKCGGGREWKLVVKVSAPVSSGGSRVDGEGSDRRVLLWESATTSLSSSLYGTSAKQERQRGNIDLPSYTDLHMLKGTLYGVPSRMRERSLLAIIGTGGWEKPPRRHIHKISELASVPWFGWRRFAHFWKVG